jgi:hypothetical protein
LVCGLLRIAGVRTALTIAAIVSLASGTAAAQSPAEAVRAPQPARYVQAGLMTGAAAPVVALNVMGAVEAGQRLADSNAWLHAAVAYGQSGDDQGPGSNFQLRAGIEGRTCGWEGHVCGVGGLDIGYQAGRWSDRDDATRRESVDALVAVPRIGLDAGGRNVRFRVGFEVDCGLAAQRERQSVSSNTGDASPGIVGIELGAGVGYQW